MKVKIKKEGKTEEFKLISKWSDVSLEKWLKLIDLKTASKTKEAEETITALSNIPKQLVKELALRDVAIILGRLVELQEKQNSSLKRIIEVEGKEYGFHPSLSNITLGEYADIETFIKDGLENNLPEIMSILYRPIVEKKNKKYTIEAYDGNISIRAEEMRKMNAEQVQSALVFFYNFAKELYQSIQLSSTEMLKEMKTLLPQNPLQKSGDILD